MSAQPPRSVLYPAVEFFHVFFVSRALPAVLGPPARRERTGCPRLGDEMLTHMRFELNRESVVFILCFCGNPAL